MKQYSKEELQKIMCSRFNYPLVFSDNIGLEYRDELKHTELRIKHPDGTRHVTLSVEGYFHNQYSRAKHFYGRLVVDGVIFRQDWCDANLESKRTGIYKNPTMLPEYVFTLRRPLTKDDINEIDGWGNYRWDGYQVGEYVMPFKTSDELIECAKQIFRQCFIGNWSLWMEDCIGPGITRKLLLPSNINV